jgi:hypothetical protein
MPKGDIRPALQTGAAAAARHDRPIADNDAALLKPAYLGDAESINKANWSYMDEGLALLAPAREGSTIFSAKRGMHKRRLLNLACSNLTWASGQLDAEFKQPFDLLVKTFAAAGSDHEVPRVDQCEAKRHVAVKHRQDLAMRQLFDT